MHGFGEAEVDEEGARRHVAYLVMELVEGESLYDRVAAGPIPWREAAQIATASPFALFLLTRRLL